jgi:hypothetical protein
VRRLLVSLVRPPSFPARVVLERNQKKKESKKSNKKGKKRNKKGPLWVALRVTSSPVRARGCTPLVFSLFGKYKKKSYSTHAPIGPPP